VIRLLPFMVLTACVDLPWGAGGSEVTPVNRGALTRLLGQEDLALAARRLASALGERFGHQLTLEGVSLPLRAESDVALQGIAASLGPVTLELSAGADLVVKVALSVGSQELYGLPEPCAGKVTLAPGVLAFTMELGSDKLGRVTFAPRGGVRWEGEAPELAIAGCALSNLQVPDFGARLAEAASSALREPLVFALPNALGLDLALSSSRVVGLDALGAGIIRASLRANERPAQLTASGLAVSFDLGLDAEAHPCGTFSPETTDTDTTPLPLQRGTSLSLSTLERIVRSAWVAGSVCGASSYTSIPEERRELPLSELPLWPGVTELLALDPEATASASFWPRELPRITADDELEDALRIEISGLEADVTAVLDGARWRLFTIELAVVIRGQLAADADGLVYFDTLDVEAYVDDTSSGLGLAPDSTIAATLVEPIVRALLESRPFLQLPPSLSPTRTTVWRVNASHTTLAGPSP
jgi:hypothetical protein